MKHFIFLFFLPGMLSAQLMTIPAGGYEVIGSTPMLDFKLNVSSGSAEEKQVVIEGQSFKTAVQLSTLAAPRNMWDIQYSIGSKLSVAQNDQMLLTFYARMLSTKDEIGLGTIMCVFEKAGPEYDKSLYRVVNLDKEWKQYFIPFKMGVSYLVGGANLNIQIGTSKQQVIELAEIQLYNYRKTIQEADLPKTEYSYKGREADAAWRKTAEEKIDTYRKSDIVFLIKDKKGVPVEGAEISVEMKKHAFGWGTAIDAATFMSNATYKANFYKNFNKAVFENDMKWPQWNSIPNQAKTLSVLNELNINKIDVRGHCLVWPSWKWLPGELKQYEKKPEALKEQVRSHIEEETKAIGSNVSEWDVFNEPYTNTDIQTICGDQVMRDWFIETKKHNTTSKLYINDFAILSGGGSDVLHQDHYFNTIKYLKEGNTPVEGIGFQGHFSLSFTTPEKVWEILDRFAEFGLEMQVTEFDIDVEDEKLQADYTRDFMTTIFAHPKMKGFMIWGFWESRHWKPNGAMYKANWTEKQNLAVWRELIYAKWWTNALGKTDKTGRYAVRGFHGEYIFTLKDNKGNIVGTGDFTLDERGKVFTLNYK